MARRWPAAVLIVGFVLAACSSSGGGSGGEATQAPQAPTAEDDSQAETGDEEGDGAAGTGTITIGDMTWQIVADIDCVDLGSNGAYFQGHAVDDPNVIVNVDAGIASGDDARLRDDAAGISWISDDSTTETSNDGPSMGTGTFFNEDGETAQGSWEFTC